MADVNWSVSNDREDNEAYIENERGVECVQIQRTDRTALTESEFDVIVDLIAAAPEMVAVLNEVRYRLANHLPLGQRQKFEDVIANIDNVLAKAEPPRTVKQRVIVEVEIEMDVEPGCPTVTILDTASCAVGCGGSDTVRHVRTSTRLG
jgi:hypothetical protein